MLTRTLVASCVCWIGFWTASLASAVEPLKTGTAFRDALDEKIDILWKDKKLRDAARTLSDARGIAILLDRRVDPDQTIALNVNNVTLEGALRGIAARCELGVAIFGNTVYLGPLKTTKRIATASAYQQENVLSEEAQKLSHLRLLPALTTDELATPEELLKAWALSAKVTLHPGQQIPHDLWPVLHYPPQHAAARASLILAGFDLAIELSKDGQHARVIKLPEQPLLTRDYAPGTNAAALLQKLIKDYPECTVKLENGKLHVVGSYEDHDAIARLLSGKKVVQTDVTSEKRYSLKIENQLLGSVATALSKQSGVEIEFDPAVEDKLKERISFSVKEVTLEELMKAMLAPVKLQMKIDGNKVKVFP